MKWGLCVAAQAVLIAPAMADAAVDAPTDAGVQPPVTLPRGKLEVVNPEGSYAPKVEFSGTGCPLDSVTGTLSPDGKLFTFGFSAFHAALTQQRSLALQSCTINITARSPQRLSFAVTSVRYAGAASLPEGVTLSTNAYAYAHGTPVAATRDSNRTDLTGPFDDDLTLVSETAPEDLAYMVCGTERYITLRLDMRLRDITPPFAAASARIADVGDAPALALGLTWRPCP